MLLIKIVFVAAMFLLLVLMGLNNTSPVNFTLPPVLNNVVQKPAALMYFGFFAIGLLSGAILSFGIGGSQKPSGGKPKS